MASRTGACRQLTTTMMTMMMSLLRRMRIMMAVRPFLDDLTNRMLVGQNANERL
jgi:hypothetical protein